jgi:hypothetical protein
MRRPGCHATSGYLKLAVEFRGISFGSMEVEMSRLNNEHPDKKL